MIFNIPPKYYIDWATLILELAIILCITVSISFGIVK